MSLTWVPQSGFSAAVRENGFTLLLSILNGGDGEWRVIAVESEGADVADVLRSHAHQFIGAYDDIVGAFTAAGAYADEWRAGQIEKCSCGEIAQKEEKRCAST